MKLTTKVLFSAGIICGIFAIASITILQLAHHHDGTTPSADIAPEVSEPIAPENITVVNSVVDAAIDISDPQALAAQSTNIALVHIDSLDGANNYSELTRQYASPYTYGQMTVLQNIQGELSGGKSLNRCYNHSMKILKQPIDKQTLAQSEYIFDGPMVKGAVDVKRNLLALDADLHADLEQLLLKDGSAQDDVWGINLWYKDEDVDLVEFDSMINVRPRQNNRSRDVEDPTIRQKIIEVVQQWLS